ncbi:UNVERIFIED_CONTAM: hypothetical protein RMT77_005273 [Armadillidium vulgare]
MTLKKAFVCLQILVSLTLLKETKADFSLRDELKSRFPNLKEIGPRLHNLTATLKMNMSLMQALNKIKNKEEFRKLFGLLSVRSGLTPALYASSKGPEIIDASNAGCLPVKTPVDITVNDNDPSALYYPSCVMLEKCGGCCYGSLLSCQPESTETVNFKIAKVRSRTRDNKLPEETVSEELVVSEEKHLSCSCKCNVKAKDCNSEIQKYNENECSCECIDTQEEAECLTKEKTHVWDSATCSCRCKDVLECSSGFQFDHADCKCFNSVLRSDLRILDFNEINGTRKMTSETMVLLILFIFQWNIKLYKFRRI